MSTAICPTITATDKHDYRAQMELVTSFAPRVHIDLMDGQLAPTVSPELSSIWWPDGVIADIHLMYQNPAQYIDQIVALKPSLVIVHAEAAGDISQIIGVLHDAGIRAGVAVLPETSVDSVAAIIEQADHVLIFSGNLGHHGGSIANTELLAKADEVRAKNPSAEIAWDGGVNDQNAPVLVSGGIDVLNVGGYIHSASDPRAAYAKLQGVTQQQTS